MHNICELQKARDNWEKQHWNNKRMIIMQNNNQTNQTQDRGLRYGSFSDNARITQVCETIFKQYAPYYFEGSNVQKEALHMIFQKMSRCFCGDVNYDDNWVDICGYAQLVIDTLEKEDLNNKMMSMEDNNKVNTVELLEQRSKNYGSFEDVARIIQLCEGIFKQYAPSYYSSPNLHREVLHMITQKLARCFCGDVSFQDHWVDIIGYAQLVINELENQQEKDNEEDDA